MEYFNNTNHERTLGSIGEIAIPIPACKHAGFSPGEVFVFQAKPGHIGIRKRDEGLRVLPDDVYLDLSSFCNGMNHTTGEENRQLIRLLTRECHRTVQNGIFFSLIRRLIQAWAGLQGPYIDPRNEDVVNTCRKICGAMDWKIEGPKN